MGPCERVVVVGVDFTEMGDDAILEGLTQVARGAARVAHFVYVHDPRVVEDEAPWPDRGEPFARVRLLSAMRQRVRDVSALTGLPYEAPQVRVHVRIGHTVAALIGAAVEHDADLLIVGTHARLALDRRILGPVADQLVRSAPCPVLIARPKNHHHFRSEHGTASAPVARLAAAPSDVSRRAS